MSIPQQHQQACTSLYTVAQSARTALIQPRSNREKERQKYILFFDTACTRRPSSTLFHNGLRSGTEKAMDSVVGRARSCSKVRHPLRCEPC